MVMFNRWRGRSKLIAGDRPLHPRLPQEPPAELSGALDKEDGAAYLRLIIQLASCGIDAAGPPVLQARHRE